MSLRRALGRLAGVAGVLWGAATLTFAAQQLMPTDPAQTILGGAGAKPSPEQLAAVNAQYGFDRPVIVQYLDYLGGLLRGDLGTSYIRKQPVTDIIGQQLGSTVTLTIAALLAAWFIAVAVTLLTAHRNRSLAALGSGWRPFSLPSRNTGWGSCCSSSSRSTCTCYLWSATADSKVWCSPH
jgi:peptide/nickel transport system permease protein